MQQGNLILRNAARDEGYWVGVLLATAVVWSILEKSTTEDALAGATCLLIAAAIILRLTLLRRWHIYTADWTLDDEKLTVGTRVVPLEDIDSVGLKNGTFTKGSLYLIIKGRQTMRLAALVRGKERDASIRSIREMGWALKQTIERLDGTEDAEG
ncbi:hypothetical protein DWX58_05290 [Pseudoflavonifractor sp. AF19-9AC]|uniref:hypothetical protein n=1 Tax=Pseudoflavonifractor sp. AF19-9AC TaxID=2292244 RepID=UPI000E4FFA91|nr:hypothetical protein [Pseudoflavonifractor sp. AF19-9AC]RHR10794.1 hypothetical protein DWX58_05290 [Pseudoflavonifractor sp. AF19-9AC]